MRKVFLVLISFLCLFCINVKADDNYDMFLPSCVTDTENGLFIPVEFSIRNSDKFMSVNNGDIHLFSIREDATCTIVSYSSEIFKNIDVDNSNGVYGVLKDEYSTGLIPKDIYDSSYVDGNFDYSKYGTSLVLNCVNDSENNSFILNFYNGPIVVGDETYCAYANKLFNKEYNVTIDDKTTLAHVVIESAETAKDNPDILYIVLLTTLTLLFFFVLLEVRRQNSYIKKKR